MARLLAPFFALGFLVCSAVSAQPAPDKKLESLEKTLPAEQKRLLLELLDLEVRQETRYFDPTQGVPFRGVSAIHGEVIDRITKMSPENAKVFWRNLPHTLRRGFRDLDPLHVSAEERKAAERLPAEAKEQVTKLLSDQIEDVLAARRKISMAARIIV